MSTWTTPITWTAGQTVTAAQMNTETRDHLNWAKGALDQLNVTSDVAPSNLGRGTTFPTTPATNDRFFRTDRGIDYYWDATRWLSVQQYTFDFQEFETISATAESGWPPADTQYDMYLEKFEQSFYIGGGTALGVSHNWSLIVKSYVGNTGTNRFAIAIDSGSSDVRRSAVIAAPIVVTGTTMFTVLATKTGTPGTLGGNGRLTYRLVG